MYVAYLLTIVFVRRGARELCVTICNGPNLRRDLQAFRVLRNTLTTLELVDALAAGIAAMRSHNGTSPPRESNSSPRDALQRELTRCGVSAVDGAAATAMDRSTVEQWLQGTRPVPC